VRNTRLFGSPLGPESPEPGFKATNDRFGPGATLSNLVRNAALHAGTPSASVNEGIERFTRNILAVFRQNANDPATTFNGSRFYVPSLSRYEVVAGNPLHALLLGLSLVILIARWRAPEFRVCSMAALGLTAAFIVFCAALKWTPWNTRYYLPLFVVGSAVVATVLVSSFSRFTNALIGAVLLFAAAPSALENQIRPLFGGLSAGGTERIAPAQAGVVFFRSP